MFDGRRNPGAPWQEQVTSFFQAKLEEEEARVGIPSLNDVQNHELTDGQLVRFRAMVQVRVLRIFAAVT